MSSYEPASNSGIPFSAIAALASLLITPAAYAELEEIVVRATKREESLKEVPIAVTAFSGVELVDRSAYKLTDITSAVPNLSYTNANNTENSNSFTIRGLNTTFNNPGIAPGVGIYVDGVYLARNATFQSALFDIQSIEVLKGPQGTLFGKNTIQGAINIVTRNPADEFIGTVSATIGNYSLWQARASISGPISRGKAAGSLTVYARDRDGTVDDIGTGTTLNGEEYYGARGKMRFTPNDKLDITISADGQWDDTSSATNDQFPIDYEVAENLVLGAEPQIFKRDIFGGAIEVNYMAGDYQVTSITGVRSFEHEFVNDQDFTPLRILDSVGRREKADWASEEFRIVSPAGEKFDWVGGIYLYTQSGDSRVEAIFGPDFGPPLGFVVNADQDVDSYALFLNANWHLTNILTLNVGLRQTWEDQVFNFEQVSDFLPTVPLFRQELDSSELSPTVSLIYRMSENANSYFKYTRGFKSGGFNNTAAFSSAAEITVVEPEFVDSYEIGLKGSFLDNRMQLNAAVFYLQYDDRQVSSFVNPVVGFAFSNAASSSSQGFEVELTAQPVDSWRFQFGVGYNDGEFDEFLDCSGPGTDCSGNPLGTPNFNAIASTQYDRQLSGGLGLLARIDAYYQDEADVVEGSFGAEERTIVNARIGLTGNSQGWELSVWGRNLTDDDGTTYSPSFIGELTGSLPEPLTYGADLTFYFD